MSDKPAEQAYHARGAGREERKFEEVLELHVNSSESMRETYRRTANSDMENFQEGFTEGVRRAIEVYGNWRIAREPGADTGTTPPLLTKQQREELVRAAHTLGDFTLETDHRAQELILLVESYMATAAERGTTPPEGRLSEIRQSIHINGDGTAALKTKDLSWMLNELELWPRRAATQRAPVEQGRETKED